MNNQLFPFQIKALSKLARLPKAILGLDQGLGKTIVAITDLTPPALIVCPASLRQNWKDEINKWRPELRVGLVINKKYSPEFDYDILIVSYELITLFTAPVINNFRPKTFILDEAHYIKNAKAKRTKRCMRLIKKIPKVRALTGTPMPNRPIELWPLLYALGQTRLSFHAYANIYCAAYRDEWGKLVVSGASNLHGLKRLIAPVLIRYEKSQVLKELPEKIYRVIALDLPVPQQEKQLNFEDIKKSKNPIPFVGVAELMQMHGLAKLPLALEFCRDALESPGKVAIFCHHKKVLDGIANGLAKFNPVVFQGDTPMAHRQGLVQLFQTDSTRRVFIGQNSAAGVGLTLTSANRVIILESPWTPAAVAQIADRCHRIGQKNAVTVDLLTIHRSIDEHVLYRLLEKLRVINQVIQPERIKMSKSANTNTVAPLIAAMRAAAQAMAAAIQALEAQAGIEDGPTILPVDDSGDTEPSAPPVQKKRGRGRPPKSETAKPNKSTKPAKSAKDELDELDDLDGDADTEEFTVDQVRDAVQSFMQENGKPATLELLTKHCHGKKKISEINPADYPALMNALEENSLDI